MSFQQFANQDFERAVMRGFLRKVLSLFTGSNNELLGYDEVREQIPIRGQHYLGSKQVPIDKIVGSMGRYHDFDRAFLPTQVRTKDRWVSIDKAHYAQVDLPPVELYKLGEIYFVKDGNHRVSVARERGQEFVDAYVTQIDISVRLTPDLRVDDLAMKKECALFLMHTGLETTRPEANLETGLPGVYERLLEHIRVHRWYLGEQRNTEVSFEDAAAHWYDTVYNPLIEIIRQQEVPKAFPGTNEADLYLWIMEYQGYLRQAYQEGEFVGDDDAKSLAAKELLADYPLPAVRKLVNALKRTLWLDKVLVKQEKVIFYEQTHLDQLRPDAHIEMTVPGQYNVLREHIDVHRWYLGEQRQADVPYEDAVASWYDRVYLPIVRTIREHGVLDEFPDRTETDLYLWVIDHQGFLREMYGREVPLEQAAEDLTQRASQGKLRDKKEG
ncbi:MAG: hypothetical protein P8Z00_16515 [Anaerolineales bacterium]|jgi:hypothetical protein